MSEVKFYNNNTEVAVVLFFKDSSKLEISWLKEARTFDIARYRSDQDEPVEHITLKLPEAQELFKFLSLPEMPKLLELA